MGSNTKVFATGTITITYPSSLVNSNSTGNSLSVSMPAYYPDDGTQTSISPSFGQGEISQNLGGTILYTFNYVSSFSVTMRMPPSTKT